jgi:hypothetical protein
MEIYRPLLEITEAQNQKIKVDKILILAENDSKKVTKLTRKKPNFGKVKDRSGF